VLSASTIVAMSEEVDLRLKHPFGMILSGPSGCGKSNFVGKLLQQMQYMVDPVPEKIHWCYAKDQPLHDNLRRTSPIPIEFHEGIPNNMEEMIHNSQKQVFVLDDLMNEISTSQRIQKLFTQGIHHDNCSLICLVQNIFPPGSYFRTIRLNSHYVVLFKNPADARQISSFSSQFAPKHMASVQKAYDDACQDRYGYLFVDLHPETNEKYRLRSNILYDDTFHKDRHKVYRVF
jgi:hypothetical protein